MGIISSFAADNNNNDETPWLLRFDGGDFGGEQCPGGELEARRRCRFLRKAGRGAWIPFSLLPFSP